MQISYAEESCALSQKFAGIKYTKLPAADIHQSRGMTWLWMSNSPSWSFICHSISYNPKLHYIISPWCYIEALCMYLPLFMLNNVHYLTPAIVILPYAYQLAYNIIPSPHRAHCMLSFYPLIPSAPIHQIMCNLFLPTVICK